MKEIVELFTNPEICAQEMIHGRSQRTVLKGIASIAQMALIIGLVGVLGIQSALALLRGMLPEGDFSLSYYLGQAGNKSLGTLAIVMAVAAAVVIIVGAVFCALVMACLLFGIKFLVGGKASFKELFLITIFSQVVAVAVLLIMMVCLVTIMITSTTVVSDYILGIMTLFAHWYLVFILVGFHTANQVSFFRSIIATLLMQSILWGIQYLIIMLIIFLG